MLFNVLAACIQKINDAISDYEGKKGKGKTRLDPNHKGSIFSKEPAHPFAVCMAADGGERQSRLQYILEDLLKKYSISFPDCLVKSGHIEGEKNFNQITIAEIADIYQAFAAIEREMQPWFEWYRKFQQKKPDKFFPSLYTCVQESLMIMVQTLQTFLQPYVGNGNPYQSDSDFLACFRENICALSNAHRQTASKGTGDTSEGEEKSISPSCSSTSCSVSSASSSSSLLASSSASSSSKTKTTKPHLDEIHYLSLIHI